MVLSDLSQGQSCRVIAIDGGMGLRQKLLLRGITEGSTIRIIARQGGPVVLEVNRSTIALGAGMADRIRVKRLDD